MTKGIEKGVNIHLGETEIVNKTKNEENIHFSIKWQEEIIQQV